MREFPLGQPLVVDATFTVSGTPTDPDAITFDVEEPDGNILTYSWPPNGAITKLDAGVFVGQFTPTKMGLHAYRMVGTGSAAGVLEEAFLVTSVLTSGLEFILTPEDFEGIRMVLGVTVLDVDNTIISSRPFGPIGEAIIMGEVEEWSAIKDDATGGSPTADGLMRWQFIVAGTQYLIASLIANTMARGGFVGLVRGEGRRTPEDWKKFAEELWGLGQQYAEQAKAPDDTDIVDLYAFPFMLISGPTRKRERYNGWAVRDPFFVSHME